MGGMKDLLGDNLFTLPTPPAAQAFDGSTYRPARDHARLKGQLAAAEADLAALQASLAPPPAAPVAPATAAKA